MWNVLSESKEVTQTKAIPSNILVYNNGSRLKLCYTPFSKWEMIGKLMEIKR